MTAERKKLGILVGGGPAPGINAVIHSAASTAMQHGWEVIGLVDGFKHLIEGQARGFPLKPDVIAYIHREGGSILRTSRANPTRSHEDLRRAGEALLKEGITALVSIGGDDTAYSAFSVVNTVQDELGFPIQSVHVPKTIDNDLPLPEGIPTFGFETARELGARLMMNLKQDAVTSQHWFLVLTMGRKAGHLALSIGKSANATVTLIPEEWSEGEIRLQEVVDILAGTVIQRLAMDKAYGVACMAEGILERLSHEDLKDLENVERDEHGHIRLAEVNFLDLLKDRLEATLAELGIELRFVKYVLGYELRCAPPTAYDIDYSRSLGEAAVEFLLEGGTNAIITLQHNQVVPLYQHDIVNPETGRTKVRMVNIDSFNYRTAYEFMTRLKPEHAKDDAYLAQLAAQTTLPLDAFKQRFGYLLEKHII